MLARLYCKIAGHRINRRKVWHDGLNFRTSCRRCGRSLIRDTDGWRSFDAMADHNEAREERTPIPGKHLHEKHLHR